MNDKRGGNGRREVELKQREFLRAETEAEEREIVARRTAEKQRQAAAEIARRKVLDSYQKQSNLKSTPVNTETTKSLSRVEWQRYHSAWQTYYQKYYSEYYSRAAQDYIKQNRTVASSEPKTEPEKTTKTEEKVAPKDDIKTHLREKIRAKASDEAQKQRKWKKFTPVIVGVVVMLIILFLQYNRLIFAPIAAYISPGEAPASSIEAVDPSVSVAVSAESKLIIPKINVEVPVAFGIDLTEVDAAMNNGVAHYRIQGASAFPGEVGNTVITGHSAGDIYSNNQYKFIFSGLERLTEGDLIYIHYNSVRYTYRVTKLATVEPTDVSALIYETEVPMLTLVTCTPLGTSRYRLLVTAEQISPTTETTATETAETTEDLPANAPTLFEQVFGGGG